MFKHQLKAISHVRHKSLWETVTSLVARDKKQAEVLVPTHQQEDLAVVGKTVRARVIGYDVGAPPRLYGPELLSALQKTFEAHPEASGLELAQHVRRETGRLVPDVVLNKQSRHDIRRFFEQQDKQAAESAQLTFHETLPNNVRTK